MEQETGKKNNFTATLVHVKVKKENIDDFIKASEKNHLNSV